MTASALRGTVEYFLPTFSRFRVDAPGRRRGNRKRQLIEVQRCQIWGDQVRRVGDVPEPGLGSDRELIRVVQARIVEVSLTVHIQVDHERIPVWNRAPAR